MGMIRAGGANHVAFLQAERMGTAEERREDKSTEDNKIRSKEGEAEVLVGMWGRRTTIGDADAPDKMD